ncbi:MAG: glycosyltransferase [Acidobacteriota bacterium]
MSQPDRPKVAFVIHRYGVDLGGGIEAHCRAVARRMLPHWDLEVLTTRARDYMTWADDFDEGREIVEGVPVRRFRVDFERDPERFARWTDSILQPGHRPDPEEEREWMKAQGPYSSGLLEYLGRHREEYALVVFFSYLYATTWFGLDAAGDRAALVPAVHDEPTLRLPIFGDLFRRCRYVLFSTIEEKRLVFERFEPSTPFAVCGGVGMEAMPIPRRRAAWPRPYLLYLGRVDHMKGCGELFSFFLTPPPTLPPVDLLLAGRATMQIPDHPRIHALGYVEEERKRSLLRDALALVLPSPFESLSLALLEAWSFAVPVIVNAACPVLRGQIARSGGGLDYGDVESFAEAVATVTRSPAERSRMGLGGLRYVRRNYRWERVEGAYLRALETVTGRLGATSRSVEGAEEGRLR